MRKQIGIYVFVAMMTAIAVNVPSFAEEEVEIETERETDAESESEPEPAVDPMSADRLLMRARIFSPAEILDAYFGEGNWDERLLTNQSTLASERSLYDGDDRKITITTDEMIYETVIVTYKGDVPDEEVLLKEWEAMLSALDIAIMDEYIKQTDYLNDDRSVYIYYVQQDGIKMSPEGYSIGKEGNDTEYFGECVRVMMADDGYYINLQRISEVVGREEVSQRQQISDEDALQAVYEAVWDGLQIPALETNPIADSLEVEIQYIPVDMGTDITEYVYDIGLYVKQLVNPDGSEKLWHFTGLVDAAMPYCYTFTMALDVDEDFQTEHLKISERK